MFANIRKISFINQQHLQQKEDIFPHLYTYKRSRVPYLPAFSQCRQQRTQFQVRSLDMDIKHVIILAMPLDWSSPETIFQVKHLPPDANGKLFAVAHGHFTEQHIGTVGVFTDVLQQHTPPPFTMMRLIDLKTSDVGCFLELIITGYLLDGDGRF